LEREGDSIIIAGNFNENICLEVFNEWKKDAGLEDVFMERNVDNHILPPTFNRGINPIDTIMCTAGIIVIKVRKSGMECVNTNVNKEFALVQINVLFKTYKEYLTQKVKK